MELASLIGKRILSPAGEALGYVKRACLTRDRKKLSSLVCVDVEEEEFYLPSRAVLSVSDALVAGKARLASPTGIPFPARCPVYTDKGEDLGLLADAILDGEGMQYVAVKDGKRTVFSADRAQEGDTMLVYPDPALKRAGGKKRAAKRRADVRVAERAQIAGMGAEIPRTKTGTEAAASSVPVTQTAVPETQVAAQTAPAAWAGENRLNLLGRQVKRTVTGSDGAPIVRAGERVTPAVLAAARRDNRLLQLTVNTLTNLY